MPAIITYRKLSGNYNAWSREMVKALSGVFKLPLLPLEHRASVKRSVSLQFLDLFRQSVEVLGRVISPSHGLYPHTGQHKHRKTHTHQTSMPKWYSNPWSQRPCERRQFMPQATRLLWPASVRAREDSSCLRTHGHCDWLAPEWAKTVHALDRSATVTG
jgi:hypothetical protein